MLQDVGGLEGLTKDFVIDHNQWVASMAAEKGATDQLKRKTKKEREWYAHEGGEKKRRCQA